jgi:hypothetical protein
MRKAVKAKQFLILALVLAEGLAGVDHVTAADSPELSEEGKVQITVHVSNRVHMQAGRLAQSEIVATQLLRQAGVQVAWLDCTVTGANDEPQPACDRPMGQADLILNFVDEIRSLRPKMKKGTLGFAMVPGDGEQGNTAYISVQRARKIATECVTPMEVILGLAAAHEIGHLLMGSGEHSRAGVMRARWDAKDLILAVKGDLRFTDDQIKKLNAGAIAREAAAISPAAGF